MNQSTKKFASAEQKLRLVHLVEADPDLRSGKFSKTFSKNEANKRWLALSHELNSIPGTKKTWREWRKTWQDRKAHVKKRYNALLRREANVNSDGSPSECPAVAKCLIFQTYDQQSLMVKGAKRRIATKFASAEQKHRLMRLVEADPQLKSGKFSRSFSKNDARKRWFMISQELNSITGTKKTWGEWRKTWQDRKAFVKKKSASQRRLANLRSSSPPITLTVGQNFIPYIQRNNANQEPKPINEFTSSQPGTSEQPECTPKIEYEGPDLRWVDAQRPEQGLTPSETVTERLLKEKIEMKRKFYNDFIKLMSLQTQALGDIASALNRSADTMSNVMQ